MAGLRDYYEANLELALPKSPISIFDVDEAIVSRGHILPPSIIHDCTISNTLVGEGSVLVVRLPRRSVPPHLRVSPYSQKSPPERHQVQNNRSVTNRL